MTAASEKLGKKLTSTILIGLSAGGFGGFREYVCKPSRYKGYICLAAYPPKKVIPKVPRNGRIRVIAGGAEEYVTKGIVKRRERSIKKRAPDFSSVVIPDEGHFFILTAEQKTRQLLQKWVTEFKPNQRS